MPYWTPTCMTTRASSPKSVPGQLVPLRPQKPFALSQNRRQQIVFPRLFGFLWTVSAGSFSTTSGGGGSTCPPDSAATSTNSDFLEEDFDFAAGFDMAG